MIIKTPPGWRTDQYYFAYLTYALTACSAKGFPPRLFEEGQPAFPLSLLTPRTTLKLNFSTLLKQNKLGFAFLLAFGGVNGNFVARAWNRYLRLEGESEIPVRV